MTPVFDKAIPKRFFTWVETYKGMQVLQYRYVDDVMLILYRYTDSLPGQLSIGLYHRKGVFGNEAFFHPYFRTDNRCWYMWLCNHVPENCRAAAEELFEMQEVLAGLQR